MLHASHTLTTTHKPSEESFSRDEIMITAARRTLPHPYTWDHNTDIALDAALRYGNRQFGFIHKYPYTTTCAPFDNMWVQQPMLSKRCAKGVRGMAYRSWCRCNLTEMNYLKEEEDLDNWLGNGLDADPNDPQAYLAPSSFLVTCVGEETSGSVLCVQCSLVDFSTLRVSRGAREEGKKYHIHLVLSTGCG